MAITERQRHQLYLRLEETLGTEEATTLMEHLPPVGWADVATKTDLEHTGALMKADMDQLRTEVRADIADLRTDVERGFKEQTRTMVLANAATMAAFGSLLLAAVKL